MEYTLTTDHLELSSLERDQIDEKIDRLQKHLTPPFTCTLRLSRNVHHKQGDVVMCSINISMGKRNFHAERTTNAVQDSLDEVIAAIKKELVRDHDKRKDHSV